MPKRCATLLAPSQLNVQYPGIKGARQDSQSMDLFIEFICICSTSVINIGGNNSKVCFMVQILHRKLQGKSTSQKRMNSNVIHILAEVIQALETLKCLLILDYCQTIECLIGVIPVISGYNYAQEDDSKLGQLILL